MQLTPGTARDFGVSRPLGKRLVWAIAGHAVLGQLNVAFWDVAAQLNRFHLCLVHIDIYDGKIIIQCNNTEDLIISALEEMGVPRPHICSGFLPSAVRALADMPECEAELALA